MGRAQWGPTGAMATARQTQATRMARGGILP